MVSAITDKPAEKPETRRAKAAQSTLGIILPIYFTGARVAMGHGTRLQARRNRKLAEIAKFYGTSYVSHGSMSWRSSRTCFCS